MAFERKSGQNAAIKLAERIDPCVICPRKCRVARKSGEVGYCGIAETVLVSSAGPHFGEESVLVGKGGSGTIFFAGCNLRCIFCQNYDISHLRRGSAVTIEELADIMLDLERGGCENINLVTPTHVIAQIVAAVEIAKDRGLFIPIVYNTGGYDSVATLKLLQGLIDIYMPDMKYSDSETAGRLSDAADYPEVNFATVKEMHRQVGDLVVEKGIARRGLLVRHLVLPENMAGSEVVMDFLADKVSVNTAVNVMAQYRPCFKAALCPEINRRPAVCEIQEVVDYAVNKGLRLIS